MFAASSFVPLVLTILFSSLESGKDFIFFYSGYLYFELSFVLCGVVAACKSDGRDLWSRGSNVNRSLILFYGKSCCQGPKLSKHSTVTINLETCLKNSPGIGMQISFH